MFPGNTRWDVSGRHCTSGDKSFKSLQSMSSAGSVNVRHVLARAGRSDVVRTYALTRASGEQWEKIMKRISCISSA